MNSPMCLVFKYMYLPANVLVFAITHTLSLISTSIHLLNVYFPSARPVTGEESDTIIIPKVDTLKLSNL